MTLVICPKCEGGRYDTFEEYTDYMTYCTLCDGKGVVDVKIKGVKN